MRGTDSPLNNAAAQQTPNGRNAFTSRTGPGCDLRRLNVEGKILLSHLGISRPEDSAFLFT